MLRFSCTLALTLTVTACAGGPRQPVTPPAPLTIASWNMEHLAEQDGSGCQPRTETDYAAMRQYAEGLGADVIAFQEVESQKAAERVFDPARYTVVIEARVGSGRRGPCRGLEGLTINPQRTGFAIRKSVPFTRDADFTALQVGDADLRSGVDITLRPRSGQPLRLLSVHLKSGCSAGQTNEACATLMRQVPVLEQWIDGRAAEGIRFAVLGDFNRRLAEPGDTVWADWDDGLPANADLTRAGGDTPARCNPRYRQFIDFIVLDRRTATDLLRFSETLYTGPALSDHCAIRATLN